MTAALLQAVDDSRVNPGLLGFIVVALLGVATWLLLRSMTRHLRRVDIPADDQGAGQEADPATGLDTPPARPDPEA